MIKIQIRNFLLFGFLVVISWAYPSKNPHKLYHVKTVPSESDLKFEQIGGYFQGDMIMETIQSRNGLRSEWFRWPDRIVYYQFDSIFDEKQRAIIRTAFDEIEKVTCAKFIAKTVDNKDYVEISGDNAGCNSHVGRIGGKQKMNLQLNGCIYVGTIIHEALHSLGFKHQHSATNRDDYIRILDENIPFDYLYAFKKFDADYMNDFGVPYDYGSVMHYDGKAFTKNGKDTIVPLVKDVKIGQRVGLSTGDIRKINRMYNCPEPEYLH